MYDEDFDDSQDDSGQVDVVWSGTDCEDRDEWDYEWDAARIICQDSQFIVQTDGGCSCYGPFDSDFDERRTEQEESEEPLILSPHWEGFNRLRWKTEIVEAFKLRADCPEWILTL